MTHDSALALAEWEGRPVVAWCTDWRIPALRAFAEVGSTNDVIRSLAADGAPAGTTAVADVQTKGRGRLGRSWHAPAGTALLASVLLRPAGGEAKHAALLPLRAGLAIAAAVAELTGADASIKWPNDVLLHGRKAAGILCEASPDFIVLGFGINVAQQEVDFPPELGSQATSLRLATGVSASRAALLGAVLQRLQPFFTSPHAALQPAELEQLRRLDALAGHDITVDDVPAGRADGIDASGALRVRADAGIRLVHAGTVRSTA